MRLRICERSELNSLWPPGAARISGTARRSALTIDAHPTAGYRLTGRGLGRAQVNATAGEVRCAPCRRAGASWQRYLIGQVLPFVAGLHGYELLHAAGVILHGRAVALAGASGTGKSTLAAALIEDGASLLADDAIALEARDGVVTAHPGTGVVFLDGAAQTHEVTPGQRLAALCVLDRGVAKPTFEFLPADDPTPILSLTYDVVRRDAARLLAHLDLMARLAATVPVVRIGVPRRARAADAARDVRRLLAAALA